jgi:glycosyltransferase involved in cell wall biosynthesis
MNQLVSIIITNYNYSLFIEKAIASAINQDYTSKEIIVVDDGSTDDSLEVIRKFGSNVKLVRKTNGGISSARNAGFLEAHGFYIAYLDADDYWEPTKLSKQISALQKSQNKLTYCRMHLFDVESGQKAISMEFRSGDFKSIFQNEPGRTPFAPSSVLMTHDLAKQVGDWDIALLRAAEDYDFYRRCSLVTKFDFDDEALVWHREHSRSLSAGSLNDYYQGNLRAFIKMLTDLELPLGFMQRRNAIFRFQIAFGKAFLKNWQILKSITMFMSILLPSKFLIFLSKTY